MKKTKIFIILFTLALFQCTLLSSVYSSDLNIYESMITKGASNSSVQIQGYWQAGSSFSLSITNTSTRDFGIYKAELKNGASVIGSTTDISNLSDGLLSPSESTSIGFSLTKAGVSKKTTC